MDVSELRCALEEGGSSEAWTSVLARFFESHHLSYGHGTDNASDEAYWLIRAQQGWLPEAWSQPPCRDLINAVVELAERRVLERKPLAYLLGEAWFAGLCFEVDERVLIPRSPLAELVERGFEPWCSLEPGDQVLDIGTGSGCLAVGTAHYCPGVMVDATDVSGEALSVARSNVEQYSLESRVRLIESDLFSAVQGRYRLMLSNPPYVPHARLGELALEYSHEPVLALEGGLSGLDIVNRILTSAADHLLADGVLIVEIGEAQEVFMALHSELPVTWLEFEHGGEGVFMLTRAELTGYLSG